MVKLTHNVIGLISFSYKDNQKRIEKIEQKVWRYLMKLVTKSDLCQRGSILSTLTEEKWESRSCDFKA